VRAVLDFANVELLEMRDLDGRLDDALDRAYQALVRQRRRPSRAAGLSRTDLSAVAQMQVDSAILFEGVNNMEALEWIIIALIALSIRLSLLPWRLGP
jgi:hypothetical protein